MTPSRSPNDDPLSPIHFLAHAAERFPSKTAVVHGEVRRSYAEFNARSHRLARALEALGVVAGDRVAILCWNLPPMLEAHFAVPLLNAVLVAINTRLNAEEILYILGHGGCKVLIVDDELAVPLGAVEDRMPPDLRVVTVHDPDLPAPPKPPFERECIDYEAFLAGASEVPVEFRLDDERRPVTLNYTSGTTGRPKGVVYTHRGLYLHSYGTAIETGIDRESVFLWTLPMFHCNGWIFPYAITLVGGTHVCLRKFRPEAVFDLAEKEGVTDFCGAPTVMLGIVQYAEESGRGFPGPMRANTAGAPPSPTLIAACTRLGVSLKHFYGLTETYGPHTYSVPHPEWNGRPEEERAVLLARQGFAAAFSRYLRVVDEEMNDVPRDGASMGQVCMRGNNVMAGYYNDPAATETAFRGGWFHSGDLAVMHPDGAIEIRDRKKDIIISGGENVSTIEVEKAVVKHPAVLEAAVIAVPDEKWGEVPKAFVTLKPGSTLEAEELIAFCRDLLAHFKCPKAVEFRDLPKTSTGKIQKYVLRDREWAGRDKRVN